MIVAVVLFVVAAIVSAVLRLGDFGGAAGNGLSWLFRGSRRSGGYARRPSWGSSDPYFSGDPSLQPDSFDAVSGGDDSGGGLVGSSSDGGGFDSGDGGGCGASDSGGSDSGGCGGDGGFDGGGGDSGGGFDSGIGGS